MLFVETKQENDISKIDVEIITNILLCVKESFSKTFADSLKKTLTEKLSVYIENKLIDSNIQYTNKDELFLFLAEKFELIQELIAVSKEAKQVFPEKELIISFNKEIDSSGFVSISLLVSCSVYSEKEQDTIREFGYKYFDIFGKHNVLFYSTTHYPQ